MTHAEVNSAELNRQLTHNATVIDGLDRLGAAIAEDARRAAPKLTGFGAASIHHEVIEDADGAQVRVSWSEEASYMAFRELGTSHENAAPFLRPAAEKKRAL